MMPTANPPKFTEMRAELLPRSAKSCDIVSSIRICSEQVAVHDLAREAHEVFALGRHFASPTS